MAKNTDTTSEIEVIETSVLVADVAGGSLVNGASTEVLAVLRDLAGAVIRLTADHNGGFIQEGDGWTERDEMHASAGNAGATIYDLAEMARKHGHHGAAAQLEGFVLTLEGFSDTLATA